MNERDLRYFSAIVQLGSLRRASERLHISQPALTKCIDRLESQLETQLFERRGRQVIVTPAGQILARRARHIMQSIDETQREITDYAKGLVGHMRLGAAATITEFLLPEALSRLIESTPGVSLSLSIGMSDVLLEGLRRDDLDMVIGPATESADLDCVPIVEDQVVVVASRHHALANQVTKIDQLRHFQWALPAKSVATRKWLEHTFEELGLPAPAIQIETNSLALLPRLLARTQLLSFVSRRNLSAYKEASPLVEIPFKETTLHRHFGLLTRKNGYLPPACEELISLLKEKGSEIFRETKSY